MRKLFIGGNWKCNNSLIQSQMLVSSLLDNLKFDPEKVGTSIYTQRWLSLPSSFI
jgi:triosephosphate isomerase